MTKIDLPYVQAYAVKGKPFYYFRRPGFKRVRLRGTPGSAEFMAAYETASAQQQPHEIGSKRTRPGTVNAAVVGYYNCLAFRSLAPSSQQMRRAILERFRTWLDDNGRECGDKSIATLPREAIMRMLNRMKPFAARNWLKTLRGLMQFAVAENFRADDPTEALKLPRAAKSNGHLTWEPEQIEQYRQRHALGTTARLALELLLNIAARRYDAHIIGPQNIQISNKDGKKKLAWRPHKTLRSTGKMLSIPIMPAFQQALDAMPKIESREPALAFLTNDYGKKFASAAVFGNKFADWCKQAGLKSVDCEDGRVRSYRAHGLRKAALVAAAHAGCTDREMMALSGHSSAKQLQEYLEEIEQELLAANAIMKVEQQRTGSV